MLSLASKERDGRIALLPSSDAHEDDTSDSPTWQAEGSPRPPHRRTLAYTLQNASPTSRFCALVLALVVLLSLVALGFHITWPVVERHDSASTSLQTAPVETEALVSSSVSHVSSGWCSNGSHSEGSWKMRDGGVWKTREELNAGFGIRQGTTAYDRCIPPGEDGSLTSAHLNRLLTAASYEWHPDSGCYLIPLARVDFITRLLQSYHGLWLIGDSLTGEHFDYLDNFLSWPGGPVSQTQVNDRRMLMFNANHPEAEFYLRRAGVPAERLARPLVWVARHDRLLNIEELGKIWEYVGVPGFSWLRPQDEAEWFGSLAATSKEQAKLAEADNPYKPTLAMVSTGAHWTRYSMNITTDEEMYLGMAEAAKRILGAISTVEHVDFFVRTQSPGHPGCEAAHEPTPIPSNDFATVAKFGKDLGWQMFSTYNKIWKDQIAERQQSLGWTRFGVVDNWNLENQRPDLHLRPPTDCLHHCMPSLQHHWTRGLWHEIKIRDLAREA